jgi:hypothetical protein
MGGVWSPNSVYFHINIVFDWYLRRVISLMLDREGRGQKWAESKSALHRPKSALRPKKCPWPKKCPPIQKVPPTQKSRYTLWSTYTQWSVKIRLPVTPWRLPSFFLIFEPWAQTQTWIFEDPEPESEVTNFGNTYTEPALSLYRVYISEIYNCQCDSDWLLRIECSFLISCFFVYNYVFINKSCSKLFIFSSLTNQFFY